MFWGLIMEPQKRYSQVIKKAFHISMASLDISNSDNQPAQVLCGYEGKNYLLCTLQKSDKLQCNLDLYFEEGCSVSFASNGKSHIHLTGYLTKDDDGLESNSDDEDVQEFEVGTKKNIRSRSREGNEKESPYKKIKLEEALEEESDDSDFNIEQLMEEESGVSEEEEDPDDVLDVLDEEEEDDDSDEIDEEDKVEEEESDDDDEIEKIVEEKVVQNGVSKKSKKKKTEEQSTPTIKSKQNKEKPQLTPGPKTKKDKSNSEEKNKGKEEKKAKDNQSPVSKKKTLSNGIVIEDLRVGQGDAATNGKFIHVYYEGRLKNNNKVFDKSLNGPGFGFRLGKGEVIKGWDIGVNGMRIGGKRRITCPPQTAYGAKGSPPVIPPNSTLVFEVELKKIK